MTNSSRTSRLRRPQPIRPRPRKRHFDEVEELDVELLALGSVDQNGEGK